MGARERRAKEKIERKELILNTAMKLVQSSGIQSLTMRKLADLIEYSPCVVYETFPNKDSLIRDLFSTVCQELCIVMQAVELGKNPEVYFKKLIRADIEFMTRDPHRVELFTLVSTEMRPQDFPPAMKEVIHLIGSGLKGLGYPQLSSKEQIEDAQDVLRTFLSGLLKLFVSHETDLARCKKILENGLNTLLKGWEKE